MAKSDLLGLVTSAVGEMVKTSGKETGTKKTTAAKKTSSSTAVAKKATTKASSSSLGFDISSLLTGAVTSAISSKVAKGALGFSDVNGDGKVDLSDILQTIVSAVQGGKINISSLSSAITKVWNAGFKSGQESKK